MTIWKVHRVMIITAALFSGAFGAQLLRFSNGEMLKQGIGVFSLMACGGLILYFRWFQKKTGNFEYKD
jgi:hypothetical protein